MKAGVCKESDIVNFTVHMIWKNGTEFISAFEQNGSRTKGFRKPERSDIDKSLLQWFK